MKPTTRLFLLFQAIPLALVLFQLGWLAFSLWYPYPFWGDMTSGYLTNWERFGPEMVMQTFWVGIEWAVFFFVVGLPFEMVVLFGKDREDIQGKPVKPMSRRERRAVARKEK